MRFLVSGVGAVGARLARQLISTAEVESVALRDERQEHLAKVFASLGPRARIDAGGYLEPADVDVVVLAGPPGSHAPAAERFVALGLPVVSVSNDLGDVRALLALDAEARERSVAVVPGAGWSPGLTCVLARHLSRRFDVVEEIHVATTGTGGPACARHRQRSLHRAAWDWRGGWVRRAGGTGRELCWFPDPIGARDCYRAELAEPALLQAAFPSARRITGRLAASFTDRLAGFVPLPWPNHPEGGPGAVRVELRGRRGGAWEVAVLGAMDRPAIGAGVLGALTAQWVGAGRFGPGAAGLATRVTDTVAFLTALRERGVRAASFRSDASVELQPLPR